MVYTSSQYMFAALKHASYVLLALLLTTSCGSDDDDSRSDSSLTIRKRENPVLTRPDGLVADPTVLRYGGNLLMVYSDYSLATDSITFNAATSSDGITWSALGADEGFRIFSGDTSSWDKLIETPELVAIDNLLHLYYIGYPESNFDNGIYTSEIGLATGAEITSLTRIDNEPTLPRGGPNDFDALTSPAVVEHEGMYYMLYTGWTNILTATGFLGLTGATSTDGLRWEKTETRLFPEVAGTRFETATEADLVKGPDALFYLFFSAEGGIALARSDQPFGPWEIYPEFIIVSEYAWESGEVVAPTALIEDGLVKVWYSGVVDNFAGSSIGYAEIDFPLDWP